VIAPFWTALLIRIYAWMVLLKDRGLLNSLLQSIGLTGEPIHFLNTTGAVVLGIVYCYLPFMILPIYTALEKIDSSIFEAAADLGSKPVSTFLKVTLPLSLPGVITGAFLVFIPAVGEFVIPELLGGGSVIMLGKLIWKGFFLNRDWPLVAAASVIIALIVAPLLMSYKAFLRRHKMREA
jgi:putrescine transport system permease protein